MEQKWKDCGPNISKFYAHCFFGSTEYNILINCQYNLNKKTMEQLVVINLTGNWIAQTLRKYCKHLVSVLRKTAGHLGFVYNELFQ